MVVARRCLFALAVLACLWFVVGIRQAHDTAQASAIVSATAQPSARAAAHARSLLSTAGFLNPDLKVNLLRGQLAALTGQHRRALQILGDVARREPDNLEAWVSLAQASTDPNSAGLRRAVREIGRLDPQVK